MNCRVVVEAAVPVFDVETPDEAIRIAISKTGEMLNPDLNYVEIDMGERTSPAGEELPPAFIAADEALVALELEMTVFNVEREEHASRIARKEIGQLLENIPLEVIEIEVIEDEDEADETDEADEETSADDESGPGDEDPAEADDSSVPDDDTAESDETGAGDDQSDTSKSSRADDSDGDDDEILPEFEDLVE